MEALALGGFIPVTTLEQRMKARGTHNSTYGTPPVWTLAFRYGYIIPNLPYPEGWKWEGKGGTWKLRRKGG